MWSSLLLGGGNRHEVGAIVLSDRNSAVWKGYATEEEAQEAWDRIQRAKLDAAAAKQAASRHAVRARDPERGMRSENRGPSAGNANATNPDVNGRSNTSGENSYPSPRSSPQATRRAYPIREKHQSRARRHASDELADGSSTTTPFQPQASVDTSYPYSESYPISQVTPRGNPLRRHTQAGSRQPRPASIFTDAADEGRLPPRAAVDTSYSYSSSNEGSRTSQWVEDISPIHNHTPRSKVESKRDIPRRYGDLVANRKSNSAQPVRPSNVNSPAHMRIISISSSSSTSSESAAAPSAQYKRYNPQPLQKPRYQSTRRPEVHDGSPRHHTGVTKISSHSAEVMQMPKTGSPLKVGSTRAGGTSSKSLHLAPVAPGEHGSPDSSQGRPAFTRNAPAAGATRGSPCKASQIQRSSTLPALRSQCRCTHDCPDCHLPRAQSSSTSNLFDAFSGPPHSIDVVHELQADPRSPIRRGTAVPVQRGQ